MKMKNDKSKWCYSEALMDPCKDCGKKHDPKTPCGEFKNERRNALERGRKRYGVEVRNAVAGGKWDGKTPNCAACGCGIAQHTVGKGYNGQDYYGLCQGCWKCEAFKNK